MSRLDEDIRGHFADLRAEDEARAPEFRKLRPVASLRPRTHVAWWLSAAAILATAGGLAVWRVARQRAPEETARASPSITTWTAPTDGLLRMSRKATSISPSLLGSALGGVVLRPGSN